MPIPERRPALTKADTKAHPVAPRPVASVVEEPASPLEDVGAALIRPAATGTTAMLSARVPAELRDEVKVYAARHRMSVQELLTEAVEQYLHQ